MKERVFSDERTEEVERIFNELQELAEKEERRSRCCQCGIGEGEDGAYIIQHPESKDLFCEECWSENCLEFYYDNIGEMINEEEEPEMN